MRCSCQVCGTYMVHSESMALGCVCPECRQRCQQCLGTNTVVSKEALRSAIERFTVKYTFEDMQNTAVSDETDKAERNDGYEQYRD